MAGVFGAGLVALCFFIGQGTDVRALNIAVLILGGSTGWLVGIIVSPYDPKEKKDFPRYAAAATAFASGYLVSKADRVLEVLLRPEFLFSPVTGFRLLAGLSGFAITLIVTYVHRAYVP
jgi:hypothetical protein